MPKSDSGLLARPLVFSLVLLAILGSSCKKPAHSTGPGPILLITLDTTRADRLGCYGSRAHLTPNLDAFAKKATVFLNCQSPLPKTSPAMATVMSGWNPSRHGIRKNMENKLPGSVPLIAEELRGAGYATGAFLSSYVLLEDSGLAKGFDTYDTSFYAPGKSPALERVAGETLARASEWVKTQGGRWFCWVHLYDPHAPYAPPSPFKEKYFMAPYDGEVAYMDACLGKFFSGLSEELDYGGATVIICADHGEGLGDHGEMNHGVLLYDATTRVPLMIKVQGRRESRTVREDVGLTDIAPTLRELCGLPPKKGDGVSLAPALSGRAFGRNPVFIKGVDSYLNYGWAPLFAAVDGGHKFILAPRPELYDLSSDPGETRNIFDGSRPPGKGLSEAATRYFESIPRPATEKVEADEEMYDNLRSLGYVGGQGGSTVNPAMTGLPDPKDMTKVMALLWRANEMLDAGKDAEAEPLLKAAIERDPDNPFALVTYAAMVVEPRDPARACEIYERIMRLRPDHQRACTRLMNILVSSGESKKALDIGGRFLQEASDFTGEVGVLTAWAAYLCNRPEEEVAKYLENGKQRSTKSLKALELKALLALRRGDRSAALDFLEEAARVTPPSAIASLEVDPLLSPLKGDPRFAEIVSKAAAAVKAGRAPVRDREPAP